MGVSQNHSSYCRNPLLIKEHVLCPAEAYSLCSERQSLSRIPRVVRIGPDFQFPYLISPAHEGGKVAGNFRFNGFDFSFIHIAGTSVDGKVFALTYYRFVRHIYFFLFLADADFGAAGNAALAHASCNYRCVGGHAAPCCQNSFCSYHAGQILG